MAGYDVDTLEKMDDILPDFDSKQLNDSLKMMAEGALEAFRRGGTQALIKYLVDQSDAPPNVKKALEFVALRTEDYMSWCLTQGMKPYDKGTVVKYVVKNAAAIGLDSGKLAADIAAWNNLSCAFTIGQVALSFKSSRLPLIQSGFPISVVSGVGLLMLDLIDIGNECEFVQEAYYHAFLKTSDASPLKPRGRPVPSVRQRNLQRASMVSTK